MIAYGLWSTISSSAPVESHVTVLNSIVRIAAAVRDPSWLECDIEDGGLSTLKAADGNLYENHWCQAWVDAASLPGDATISTSVDSSDSASTIAVTVANSGEVVWTSDQGMTYTCDLKALLLALLVAGNNALKNSSETRATAFNDLFDTLKAARWQ